MKKTLEEIRQQNLKQILEDDFDNDLASLSKKIHRGKSTISKYLSKSLIRRVSKNTARSIERSLELPTGYLDEEYHGTLLVYYVTLKVSRNFTYDVVERVYDYPEAVECSALLGEFDVLIKVEVPSFHELQVFYDKLSRMPGVQRTRTYPAVETIRWQRPQSAYSVLRNPNEFTNYAEKYKHQRILEYMEEIRKLEHGDISSDGLLQNQVDLSELMRNVKHSYLAIRLHDETYDNEIAYNDAEREQLAKGVSVKRIITLPMAMTTDKSQARQFQSLLNTAQRLMEMGSEIRFVYLQNWIASTKNRMPECFAVVDGEYVYLKQGEKHARLLTHNDDISSYANAFRVNWDRAIPISHLSSDFDSSE